MRFRPARRFLADVADHPTSGPITRMLGDMWTVLLILLVAWVVLSILGFVLKGLLWLAIIGIVLFVGTVIFGILRQRARGSRK